MISLIDIKLKNPYLSTPQIMGLFYILENNKTFAINDLVQATGLPKETVKRFIDSISDFLSVSKSGLFFLNDLGKEFVKSNNCQPFKWCLLSYESKELEEKIELVKKALGGVLKPKRDYDQFFASVKTSISKALIVKDLGLIEDGTQIAVLGDDDLVSLVLSLVNPFLFIQVFDVDKDILNAIEKGKDILGLNNIKTFLYDVREELPSVHKNKYQVVLTDPPYTKTGFYLFLKRAIQLSGYDFSKNVPRYIFAHYGASFKTPEKFLRVQQIINSFRLWEKNVIYNFAVYDKAEEMGSRSTLYVLQTTPQTNTDSLIFSKYIYTYQTQFEDKFPYVEHLAVKIYNVPDNIVKSKKKLLKILGEFCKIHRLNVVSSKVYRFKPIGYSITFILSGSNLSVHTWPENKAVYVDLVYCSPIFNKDKLALTLSGLFGSDHIELNTLL